MGPYSYVTGVFIKRMPCKKADSHTGRIPHKNGNYVVTSLRSTKKLGEKPGTNPSLKPSGGVW